MNYYLPLIQLCCLLAYFIILPSFTIPLTLHFPEIPFEGQNLLLLGLSLAKQIVDVLMTLALVLFKGFQFEVFLIAFVLHSDEFLINLFCDSVEALGGWTAARSNSTRNIA